MQERGKFREFFNPNFQEYIFDVEVKILPAVQNCFMYGSETQSGKIENGK